MVLHTFSHASSRVLDLALKNAKEEHVPAMTLPVRKERVKSMQCSRIKDTGHRTRQQGVQAHTGRVVALHCEGGGGEGRLVGPEVVVNVLQRLQVAAVDVGVGVDDAGHVDLIDGDVHELAAVRQQPQLLLEQGV